jgi:hypothetical protein
MTHRVERMIPYPAPSTTTLMIQKDGVESLRLKPGHILSSCDKKGSFAPLHQESET